NRATSRSTKGYVTNIAAIVLPPAEVIFKYHDLWHVEQSFRMSKTDLKPDPSSPAPVMRSVPTSQLCSPPWPSLARSKTAPACPTAQSCARYVPQPWRSMASFAPPSAINDSKQTILDAICHDRPKH